MPEVIDLGTITDLNAELDINPFVNFFATPGTASNDVASDMELARKATQDAKAAPSIWFVNFVGQDVDEKARLRQVVQEVEDYLAWATTIWWTNVTTHPAVPQDDSPESAAARTAYHAKIAAHHVKTTPWLALNFETDVSKIIECRVHDFHTELIRAVLDGFVDVTPTVLSKLEQILESLRRSITQISRSAESRTLFGTRYEYNAAIDDVKSYVRVISFTITESMKNIQKAKKTEAWVRCEIRYKDMEANFNRSLWKKIEPELGELSQKHMREFINQQTINCPP